MKLQIKILDPKIREKMPSYASLGSAGLDLRAVMSSSPVKPSSSKPVLRSTSAIPVMQL